jgi:hypothetical protein
MVFKLLETAQQRWRHLDRERLPPLIPTGVQFCRWRSEIERNSFRPTDSTDAQSSRSIYKFSQLLLLENYQSAPDLCQF